MESVKKSGKLELLALKTVKIIEKDQQDQLKGGDGAAQGSNGSSAVDWTAVDVR